MKYKQPWIYNAKVDLGFILLPSFYVLLLIILFPSLFGEHAILNEWQWVVFILLIDVAHVYSSLYRTYIDKATVRAFRKELLLMPILLWVSMVILYNLGSIIFWRFLAYLAVFHFIRQQYGFMRVYQRKDEMPAWKYRIDLISVYGFTGLPILYWHFNYPRAFDWFLQGDFISLSLPNAGNVIKALFALLAIIYVLSEITFSKSSRFFNWPKNLLLVSTAFVWYLGIVQFNGDVTFTLFNVVSHGIPYMALVWVYGRKKYVDNASDLQTFNRRFFTGAGIAFFLGIIFLLAFLEEGLWNSLVWDEHKQVFSFFTGLPQVKQDDILSLLVPTLSLPQVTHYMIDAFIWKMRSDRDQWQKTLS